MRLCRRNKRFTEASHRPKHRASHRAAHRASHTASYSQSSSLKNHGQIISITTAQALIGFPNASAYAASKHALHGFLETLQLELGNKIKISNVYLGWIKGTNLRANALGPDGAKIGSKHHKHSS